MTIRKPGDEATGETAEAATTQETKGSVQEAIGKLIGDDAARRKGAAKKRARADVDSSDRRHPRP